MSLIFISYASRGDAQSYRRRGDVHCQLQSISRLEGSSQTFLIFFSGHGRRGDGQSRFLAPLMGRIAATRFVNGQAMGPIEDLAYKQVYGRDIARSVRQVLECTLKLQAENNEHPTAEKLNKRIQKTIGVCRPVARTLIKLAKKYGLISEEEDGRRLFTF